MQISPGLDLTYCTNIHAGESWEEVETSVAQYAPRLKERVSPGAPFGLGLRLSAQAATALLEGERLERFVGFLAEQDLYVALINGFPYGSFHGTAVKTAVFAPDFRDPARVRYTLDLARVLSRLTPAGMDGGISTIPLSYKPWLREAETLETAWPVIVGHLVDVVAELVALRERTGCWLHVDIEPEPNGLVETTVELVAFFEGPLAMLGAPRLARQLGISVQSAEERLREHVQECFDVCHMAIQFEDVVGSLQQLRARGVRVGRVQVSSALRFCLDGSRAEREAMQRELRAFDNGVYLHQVVERDAEGRLHRYADLDAAMAASAPEGPSEWRVHFHVPLFTERYGAALSTQGETRAVLARASTEEITPHLEIETYTWGVLPGTLKTDLLASIKREFRWVLDELCTRP